jgi:hypothetical protein
VSASRLLGRHTRYVGATHPGLYGCRVVIVAVLKPPRDGDDGRYLRTEGELGAAGGLVPGDRLEVRPILPDGRVSFVASDAAPEELSAFQPPTETSDDDRFDD